jgi:hypothetical protein
MQDPEAIEDWQLAVNLAQALISIDLASRYGRMDIDPKCNIQRCEDLLSRGKSLGVEPIGRQVDTIIRALSEAPEPKTCFRRRPAMAGA